MKPMNVSFLNNRGQQLAALGACTSMTLQMYGRLKKLPLEKAVVRLAHKKFMLKTVGIVKQQTVRAIAWNTKLNELVR